MNDAAQEQHVGTAGRQRERMVVAVGRVAMAAEFAQRETRARIASNVRPASAIARSQSATAAAWWPSARCVSLRFT
jgi:hypothetical protein